MKVQIRVLGLSSSVRWLEPGATLNIGSAPGPTGARDICVPGRPALSRRAVELYNSGDQLIVTSFQRTASGTVRIGPAGGAEPRVAITAPTPFRQPIEFDATVTFFDDSAPVTIRVIDDRTAADIAVTSVPDQSAAPASDLDLLVNCIAVYAEDHPGERISQVGIAELYLPCLEISPNSYRRLRDDLRGLCSRYGFKDYRGLDDMLAAGRARGHVTTASLANARPRIGEGARWLRGQKALRSRKNIPEE